MTSRVRDTEVTPGLGGSAASSLRFSTGDIIDDKYQVDDILGEGGMGMVLSATHLHLRQRVALKFMRPEAMDIPEAMARFSREARAAARLRGEHVCRVLDMGQASGAPYIVIEHLEGEDLSALLARHGQIPGPDAVGLILQAADAMAEAHAAGIIHRDLKPSNLFVTTRADGTPWLKVLDFGISKLIGQDTTSNLVDTRSHALIGSPLYMAPEQLLSARDVDPRADIWALGVILFQLLSGRTPAMGESLPETITKVLHDDAPRLSSVVPAVDPRLDEAVARCLCRDRAARFPSVAALAAALAPMAPAWAAHLPGRIEAALGPAVAPSRAAPPRQLSWPRIGLALAVVAALAIGIPMWISGGSPPSRDTEGEDRIGETRHPGEPAIEPAPIAAPAVADAAPASVSPPGEVGAAGDSEAGASDSEANEAGETDSGETRAAAPGERPRRKRRPARHPHRKPRPRPPAPDPPAPEKEEHAVSDPALPPLLAPSDDSASEPRDPEPALPDILAPE